MMIGFRASFGRHPTYLDRGEMDTDRLMVMALGLSVQSSRR